MTTSSTNRWTVAATFIGVLALLWAVFAYLKPPNPSSRLLPTAVLGNSGKPAKVVLVGPDGTEIFTRPDGSAEVPSRWADQLVRVTSVSDRRLLATVRLVASESGTIQLTVPDGN
jgi:hypothetical protein